MKFRKYILSNTNIIYNSVSSFLMTLIFLKFHFQEALTSHGFDLLKIIIYP